MNNMRQHNLRGRGQAGDEALRCRPGPGRHGDWKLIHRLFLVTILGMGICGVHPQAHGDAVKLGGFWIDGVDVQNIADGKVYYYNSVGSEFVQPLDKLHGLKIDRYPQLARFDQAAQAGDDTTALEALLDAQVTVIEPWLRQWIQFQTMNVYDRLNLPIKAIETFLRLAYESAPKQYLAKPPLKSLAQASDVVKADLHTRLTSAQTDLSVGPSADPIRQALQALSNDKSDEGETPSPVVDNSDEGSPADHDDHGKTPDQPASASTTLILPKVLDLGDPITKMLLSRDYAAALSAVDRLLATENKQVAMRLFQRGLAQLGMGDVTHNHDRYLDAGLTFMRVVSHYPTTRYAGPSLVEAAVVHTKIGRHNVAARLCRQAQVLIDSEEDSNYGAKLSRIVQQVENMN